MLQRTGLEERIGPDRIHPTVRLAVMSLGFPAAGAQDPPGPP
jgi:hypothetical protein